MLVGSDVSSQPWAIAPLMSSSMLVGALSGEGKTRHKGDSTDMTKCRSPIGIRHDHETSVFRDGLFWTVAKTGVEKELPTEYSMEYTQDRWEP